MKRSAAEASAARLGPETVSSDAFVFGSESAARKVLTAWKRHRRALTLKLGQDGAIVSTRSGRLFTTVWREGTRLGVLIVRWSSGQGSQAAATAPAPLADLDLRSALAVTAWDKVMAQARPDGSLPTQAALQGLALTYGSLPGVDPPSGAPSTQPSGTSAALPVLAQLGRLSARLRRAVLERLDLAGGGQRAHDASAQSLRGAGPRARDASYGDPNFTPSTALTAEASVWAAREGMMLPGDPTMALTIVAGYARLKKTDAADAYPVNAKGDLSDAGPYCRVRVDLAKQGGGSEQLATTLAHEVFHCWEFDLAPGRWEGDGDWMMEGLAEWASLTVVKPPYDPEGQFITQYIKTADAPTFERTYSAIGFWGHVQDTTGDLWSRIPSILRTTSAAAGFAAAGGNEDQFLSTWASSQVRASTGGPEWDMFSPLRPPGSATLKVDAIKDTVEDLSLTVAPYSTQHVEIQPFPDEPLLHVALTAGVGRLSVMHNYTSLGDGWFCMTSSCQCPPGSSSMPPSSQPLEAGADLALAGGGSGTDVELEFHSLKEFCSGLEVTQTDKGSCVGCGSPPTLVFEVTQPGTCVLDTAGTVTVTLTGDGGGSLVLTVPGYAALPTRSDGAKVIQFQAPRDGGPDVVLPGTDWSSGDFFAQDPGIQIPQGVGTIQKDGRGGTLAVILFSPSVGDAASRLASGSFSCKSPIK